MSENLELRWRGPCDMSGYGIACIGYAIGLTQAGLHVRLVDKSRSMNLAGKGMDLLIQNRLEELQSVPINTNAPTVQHQVADQMRPSKAAKLNIGYTIFEMTSIPSSWVKYCNDMDQIWTGSQYSKEAFVNSGVDEGKIHVIPHILDFDRYNVNVEPLPLPRKAGFNFLSVFDFQERKAWRELLTAYVNEFTQKDDVCLWLKCYQNGFTKNDQINVITRIMYFIKELGVENPPRIEVCPFDIPYHKMPSFFASFDAYVSIAREGFGLPFAEAAAVGLTIIGPEVGGVREFLNENNSYLVEYTGDRPISKEMIKINPTFVDMEWASHSVDDLRLKMRMASEQLETNSSKVRQLVQDVQEKLHYSVIGEKVRALIDV